MLVLHLKRSFTVMDPGNLLHAVNARTRFLENRYSIISAIRKWHFANSVNKDWL
jgi:hypothetical protein